MFQTEGEHRAAALDSMRKLRCFFTLKHVNLFLAENYEPEIENNMSPLITTQQKHGNVLSKHCFQYT